MRTEEFVTKARALHGDLYDYSQSQFVNWKTPITIVCPIHGVFKSWPETHLKGAGCKRCSLIKASRSKSAELARRFEERARAVHGDKYDYSSVQYVASGSKVSIRCPTHGPFLQTPSNHISSGKGCPRCGRLAAGMKATAEALFAAAKTPAEMTEAFIREARRTHGDRYGYDRSKFSNFGTPIEIFCKTHGYYFQQPRRHLDGAGCKRCGDKARGDAKKSRAAAEFVSRAQKVHGDKYDYSKAHYVSAFQKVEVVCPSHGSFFIRPTNLHRGTGCPKCGDLAMASKQSKGQEAFLSEARTVHGDTYDYSRVRYTRYHGPVEIVCKKHGAYRQTPAAHLAGRGCRKCGIEKQAEGMRWTSEEFISRAREKHGDKYDYSRLNYVDMSSPVTIVCPVHGEFRQVGFKHVSAGQGCPKCANRDMNLEKFIQRARSIHGDKYDYSKVVYERARKHVEIVCPVHGSFRQWAASHLAGIGCPACVDLLNSKGVRIIENWLTERGIAFEREKQFESLRSKKRGNKGYRFDFWLPDFNAVIEFDGPQHFEARPLFGGVKAFLDLQERDRRKDEWAATNGVKMIRIRYDQASAASRTIESALEISTTDPK